MSYEQLKSVTWPDFSTKDLGLALAPKICPDQSQAFKEVNDSQAFPQEKKHTFFLNEPLPGAPRHVGTVLGPL